MDNKICEINLCPQYRPLNLPHKWNNSVELEMGLDVRGCIGGYNRSWALGQSVICCSKHSYWNCTSWFPTQVMFVFTVHCLPTLLDRSQQWIGLPRRQCGKYHLLLRFPFTKTKWTDLWLDLICYHSISDYFQIAISWWFLSCHGDFVLFSLLFTWASYWAIYGIVMLLKEYLNFHFSLKEIPKNAPQ